MLLLMYHTLNYLIKKNKSLLNKTTDNKNKKNLKKIFTFKQNQIYLKESC